MSEAFDKAVGEAIAEADGMYPTHRCEGCLKALSVFEAVAGYTVCMACVKARHRAAITHKCACGAGYRRYSDLHETHPGRDFGRKWYDCLRCLGQIKQVQ